MIYDYASYDSGREAPGTRLLFQTIEKGWPGVKLLGIYARRSIRGSDRLSLHAEGRAVDFTPPNAEAREHIAQWAVDNAQTLGVQEVIIYETKKIWTTARSAEGWRRYDGVSSGLTHIHIGQHRIGAGITGGKIDPRVMAATLVDVAEAQGFRLWHAGAVAVIGLALMAHERGHRLRRIARSTTHAY